MKKIIIVLLAVILALAAGTVAAEESELPGKPFEDFTATDTEGNVFTLSEALKDHEAVLINFWATWCPPCQNEMPHLQKLWETYGDRVAMIALSTEPEDTVEKISAFREEYGLTFPMGRDEDQALSARLNASGIPDTVIVDRFGNVGFYRVGTFFTYEDLERTVTPFLGEGYAETKVLKEIPKDSSTGAFPVSAKRAVYVENENARKILFHFDEEREGDPLVCYIVPEEKARIRIAITAADDPATMIYSDAWGDNLAVSNLLDPQRNEYVYEQAVQGEFDGVVYHYGYGILIDTMDGSGVEIILTPDEQYLGEIEQNLAESDLHNITWEYAEDEKENALQAYLIHVVDQYGDPVAEAVVNFCTDTACVPAEADENGLITFDGAPDKYHLQLIDLPEGYSSDEDFEMYTGAEYSEWVLRVKKD